MENQPLTLLQFTRRIAALVTHPSVTDVWVTAELSDLAVRGGHCYTELLDKNPDTGAINARIRGIIWASNYSRLAYKFLSATGQQLASGIKVMVRGSANYSPAYGLSMVITDINPEFTMGDLMRRRREILARLQREGVLECNRTLEWPVPALRVAVISAPGAAGYGDFINQLYHNEWRLKFTTRLFEAVMQGERAPRSIINALEAVASDSEQWDCVVLIRGGGSTSDLASFDDYDLAANIAQFPIPVISGIGHERDVTVIDYVANMRVKTPTAAAEFLISRGAELLGSIERQATNVARIASERISGAREQLSYYSGLIPTLPLRAVDRQRSRLNSALTALSATASRRISPAIGRLDNILESLPRLTANVIANHQRRLDSTAQLLEALSPAATLKRGYSITRVDGKAITSLSQALPGTVITTVVADGQFQSTV